MSTEVMDQMIASLMLDPFFKTIMILVLFSVIFGFICFLIEIYEKSTMPKKEEFPPLSGSNQEPKEIPETPPTIIINTTINNVTHNEIKEVHQNEL